jgi:hypothetical protein
MGIHQTKVAQKGYRSGEELKEAARKALAVLPQQCCVGTHTHPQTINCHENGGARNGSS